MTDQGERHEGSSSGDNQMLSRRELVKGAGAGALALGGASTILAACGGGSSTTGTSTGAGTTATSASAGGDPFAAYAATAPNPSKGGNLRVGMIGAGTSETYNPFIASTPIDGMHCACVYDWMIRPAPYGQREPGLIVDWKSNSDATIWELSLRPDVVWHDGKPLTPEDVIYSFRQMASKSSLGGYAVASVRLAELKKTGKNTLQVPLTVPIADLAGYFFYLNTGHIVQDGTTNYSKPIGTGPYKLEQFYPGQRSVLSANRDYWDSPKPYPDQLEIISINDPTARLNALEGGAIDICSQVPYVIGKANLTNAAYKVIVGHPGLGYMFYMRCDTGPFRDPRVREAMKLIPDRQAMIDATLSGFGSVGNDLQCPGVKYYDTSLPQRTQDIERAKSLLKAAGASDLTVTLDTSEVLTGFTEAATVFAEQAKAAGVNIVLNQQEPSQYFDPTIYYLKERFAQDAWPGPSIVNNYSQQFLIGSAANETHYDSPGFDQLFARAQAETNPDKAEDLWNQVQAVQYNQGGALVWAYIRNVTAVSNKVRGYGAPGSGWLYVNDDERVWNWGLA